MSPSPPLPCPYSHCNTWQCSQNSLWWTSSNICFYREKCKCGPRPWHKLCTTFWDFLRWTEKKHYLLLSSLTCLLILKVPLCHSVISSGNMQCSGRVLCAKLDSLHCPWNCTYHWYCTLLKQSMFIYNKIAVTWVSYKNSKHVFMYVVLQLTYRAVLYSYMLFMHEDMLYSNLSRRCVNSFLLWVENNIAVHIQDRW